MPGHPGGSIPDTHQCLPRHSGMRDSHSRKRVSDVLAPDISCSNLIVSVALHEDACTSEEIQASRTDRQLLTCYFLGERYSEGAFCSICPITLIAAPAGNGHRC